MKKGFTLIELLVSVGIIALLSAVVMINVTNTRAKTRDARREADISSIVKSLTLYLNEQRNYPVYSGKISGSDALSQGLVNAGVISRVPADPLDNGGCLPVSGPYIYCYESTDGKSFTIFYFLETDSIVGKTAGLQQVSQ